MYCQTFEHEFFTSSYAQVTSSVYHLLIIFFMQFVSTFAMDVSPEHLANHYCQISNLRAITLI